MTTAKNFKSILINRIANHESNLLSINLELKKNTNLAPQLKKSRAIIQQRLSECKHLFKLIK
jgi:hypothetical protein